MAFNGAACTSEFCNLYKQKWSSEETKINLLSSCTTVFNYHSNSKLDNNCLEIFRYDHSIYFKTIGEMRNNKNDVAKLG
ncbi:hypothetical protein HN011_008937 [Eciton burchellii]|nr:hypothetical protein HN011_008937 [Eciton burchellii]